MLKGIEMDENPLLSPNMIGKIVDVIHDGEFAVVHKPHEFLSVPGKTIQSQCCNVCGINTPNQPAL